MMLRSSVILFLLLATTASAQNPVRPGRGAARRGGAPGDSAGVLPPPPRAQRAARQAIERLVRVQLRPSESQLLQLQRTDARFEIERMRLNREEMMLRGQLRLLMQDTANVDQAKIGQAQDRLVAFPARRAALLEAEQKELATFLTPLQRAKYHAIQEQVRRQIERGRGGPPPPATAPRSKLP